MFFFLQLCTTKQYTSIQLSQYPKWKRGQKKYIVIEKKSHFANDIQNANNLV